MKMRELKFRVWDNVDYMSTPFTLQDVQSGKVQFTSECPVMQYASMKDKKRVEIYDGDLVEWKTGAMYGVSRISFYDGGFRLADYVTEDNLLNSDYAKKCCKVIGNIYQNPELIKLID